jgi:hypothetical protein
MFLKKIIVNVIDEFYFLPPLNLPLLGRLLLPFPAGERAGDRGLNIIQENVNVIDEF